jgi:hypothetical protein
LTDDRRGAQVIFTFNSHARRQLREKVSSWDLVVTGVAISGDSGQNKVAITNTLV